MPLFHYKSVDLQGKKLSGIIEAKNCDTAKEKLRAQHVMLISIDERKRFFRQEKLRGSALIAYTSQLAQLLSSGLPLFDSLTALEEQYRGEKFHATLISICEQIQEGSSLSAALAHFPESFSPLYCAMVAAGESVGALDKTLEQLSSLLSKQNKLRKQLTTALTYPFLLAGFSLIVILLLMTFVIPSLEAIFEGRPVNQFTHLVIATSHFITEQWPLYLSALGSVAAALFFTFRSPRGKLFYHRSLFHIPLVKTLITQTALARFSRTMGTLLRGGVSIINALQISRKVMQNPILEEEIEAAEQKIVAGSSLSHELRKSKRIPLLVPRMLAVGEEAGNNAIMLHSIADLYEQEVEKSLNRLTTLAQPAILLVMGGVVGIIMMAVILPLTDINAFI